MVAAPRLGNAVSGLRLGSAIALAVVAALAALLAADVRSRRTAIVQGDAVYSVTPARASWSPPTRLGGLTEIMLGTGDEIAFRRALQLYRASTAVPQSLDTAVEVQTLRSEAEKALAGPAASSDAARASQARTLLGILAFDESAAGAGPAQADAAIADFTDAVRVDPRNGAAKFDLELLLRLTAAHGSRAGAGQTHGSGHAGRRGAGGGVPGSGY
jgi:hypothetical protein